MKLKWIAVAIGGLTLALSSQAIAAASSNYTVNSGPPLNSYGAVDVNAIIPYNIQVPPKPAGFQDPIINPLSNQWSSIVPTAPDLDVRSYILMSANSGQILAAYNANEREAPASITKLMLIYITQQALSRGTIHLDDMATVPVVAWATGGSRMFLKPRQQVKVRDLISGIIVDSGNDAAVTLAQYIAGTQSDFVDMMNDQAKALDMTNTHFNDVMGLPAPNHYSSAYDLAHLTRAILMQYPQYSSWFSEKSFKYNGIKQANFNKLLFIYPYAIGMKTGSTEEAGYSLVGAAKIPSMPTELIAVVLGAPGETATNNQSAGDAKALLTYGFRFFKDRELYPAGKTIQSVTLNDGTQSTVPVGVQDNLWVTVPVGLGDKLSAQLQIKKGLKAPVTKGQNVGRVVVTLNGQPLKTAPAVALATVKQGNFFQRLLH